MKAVVWTKYGPPDVLQLKEVATPTHKDNEVLITNYTTTVTAGDCEQRSLNLPIWYALTMRAYAGLRRPERITILGMELAGEIEATGKEVRLFKKGDQVFAAIGFRSEDLVFLKELVEAGKMKSVFDRSYPLEQTAEAHRYVESGQKAGNVLLTVEHNIQA